ncbi:hypothetical protein NC652_016923 [Populus alba x Populus x berolinensis]|nr:hypothetical protein NC652_016923 [Populus alba x Populus x berolinensis]KAJ6994799.1 hypothetical protein NC653_017562 [Populus alba x Populus x berolinensis]
MFTRMTTITNSLDALGKTYTNIDIMSKILRFLPKTWEAKVTTIREAKNHTQLSLEELISSLITHKITMEKQELEEKPKKNLAFKTIHHADSDNDDYEFSTKNLILILYMYESREYGEWLLNSPSLRHMTKDDLFF